MTFFAKKPWKLICVQRTQALLSVSSVILIPWSDMGGWDALLSVPSVTWGASQPNSWDQ